MDTNAVLDPLRIEEANEETHLELASWRYPPPYDFNDSGAMAGSGYPVKEPV
jgi:hypothetical protein